MTERAAAFAAAYAASGGHGAIPAAHGSYRALLADPDVDVVYVATPHDPEIIDAPLTGAGYAHELAEVTERVAGGHTESEIMAEVAVTRVPAAASVPVTPPVTRPAVR